MPTPLPYFDEAAISAALTYEALIPAMRQALAKISKLPAVKARPVMFRVEDFE